MIKNDAKIIKIDNMSSTVPIKPEGKRGEERRSGERRGEEGKRGGERRRGEKRGRGERRKEERRGAGHTHPFQRFVLTLSADQHPHQNSTPTAPTNGWHGCGTRRWGLEPTAEGGILVIGR
jgi:hypothetical protein